MTRKVAEVVVDVLAAAGVKHVYGIVSDSLNGFTDALRKARNMEWVHVRTAGSFSFNRNDYHRAAPQFRT